MVFHFILVLSLISLAHGGANSSLPAEMYWKSMLPHTLMPKALQQLLINAGTIVSTFNQEDVLGNLPRAIYKNGYWAAVFKSLDKNHTFNATTIFFLRDNLRPGERMSLTFTKTSSGSSFLPRELAESIPFSSSKFSEILNDTSINSTSEEARIMKQTLGECEAPGIKGEDKKCATSLESLVDFVVGKFGHKVQTLCNEVDKENQVEEYVIQKGIKMMGQNQIVCHKQPYAYAVFYCHRISDTNVYMVPLVAADGSDARAVAVCHFDTSDWNPRHFAFRVLNVKPGGPPICHFLNNDSIVWLPS